MPISNRPQLRGFNPNSLPRLITCSPSNKEPQAREGLRLELNGAGGNLGCRGPAPREDEHGALSHSMTKRDYGYSGGPAVQRVQIPAKSLRAATRSQANCRRCPH